MARKEEKRVMVRSGRSARTARRALMPPVLPAPVGMNWEYLQEHSMVCKLLQQPLHDTLLYCRNASVYMDVPSEHHHSIEKVPGVAEVAVDTAKRHNTQNHFYRKHNIES